MEYREAISILKTWRVTGDKEHEAFDMAISALQAQEETVSRKVYEQISWERDIAVMQLKDLGYGLGEKIRTDGDTISRQAAIDELKRISFSHCFECGEYLSEDIREIEIISSNKALESIEALPSAQPEIVRCKDCEHRDPEDKKCDCGHAILWQLPRQDDWYCADAKRRTDAED